MSWWNTKLIFPCNSHAGSGINVALFLFYLHFKDYTYRGSRNIKWQLLKFVLTYTVLSMYIQCQVHTLSGAYSVRYIQCQVHTVSGTYIIRCIQCQVHTVSGTYSVRYIQCRVTDSSNLCNYASFKLFVVVRYSIAMILYDRSTRFFPRYLYIHRRLNLF